MKKIKKIVIEKNNFSGLCYKPAGELKLGDIIAQDWCGGKAPATEWEHSDRFFANGAVAATLAARSRFAIVTKIGKDHIFAEIR